MTTTAVQSRLKELGFYVGAVDGDAGPATKAAIRAFQRINNLAVDGVAGPKTQAKLFPAQAYARDVVPPAAEPAHIKPVWPRQADMVRFYGEPGKYQTTLVLPWPMKVAWDKRKAVNHFSVHEKVHDSAARVFNRIGDAYSKERRADLGIDLWGGCLNVRKMRGGSLWSMHAWGTAIDFDPARNELHWGRARARLAKPDAETFWRLWEEEGWVSLGRARNFDWMHVQAARL